MIEENLKKVPNYFKDISDNQLGIMSMYKNPVVIGNRLCMQVLVNREPSIRYIPLSMLPVFFECLKTEEELENANRRIS